MLQSCAMPQIGSQPSAVEVHQNLENRQLSKFVNVEVGE